MLLSYKEVSEQTGIPLRRLQRMALRGGLRTIRKNRIVYFTHLDEDLARMVRPKKKEQTIQLELERQIVDFGSSLQLRPQGLQPPRVSG